MQCVVVDFREVVSPESSAADTHSLLQCVAVCCSALQCVAVCCC